MPLIGIKDFERVSPVFAGKQGNALARRLMHWVAIDKIGELYDRNIAYQGPAFVDHIFDDIGIDYPDGRVRNVGIAQRRTFHYGQQPSLRRH